MISNCTVRGHAASRRVRQTEGGDWTYALIRGKLQQQGSNSLWTGGLLPSTALFVHHSYVVSARLRPTSPCTVFHTELVASVSKTASLKYVTEHALQVFFFQGSDRENRLDGAVCRRPVCLSRRLGGEVRRGGSFSSHTTRGDGDDYYIADDVMLLLGRTVDATSTVVALRFTILWHGANTVDLRAVIYVV